MEIVLITVALIAFSILIAFNTHAISVALRNCKRIDGTTSWKRTLKEGKYLSYYCGGTLLMVVMVVSAIYASVLAVHTYFTPLGILSTGRNPLVFEREIDQRPMWGLEREYEEWEQGYSPATPEILDVHKKISTRREAFPNWVLLLIFLAIVAASLYILHARVFPVITNYYAAQALRRRDGYYRRDRLRALSSSQPSPATAEFEPEPDEPLPKVITVAKAKTQPVDSEVLMVGNIVSQVSSDDYIFQDETGQIQVQLNSNLRKSQNDMLQTEEVAIFGEIDKDGNQVKVNVQGLEILAQETSPQLQG